MLGAIFGGSLGKLPKQMAELVWEARNDSYRWDLFFFLSRIRFKLRISQSLQVRVDPSPALIRPLKPKLWLTGKLAVPAHTAVLIP